MKRINLKLLNQLKACGVAVEAFEKHRPGNSLLDVTNKAMELRRFDWANWLLTRLMNKKQKVQYAIFAAELVLKIYEARFPGDDSPRLAIDAAKNYLKKPSKKTKAAAHDAAHAAAYAAHAAHDAAHAAAHDAAHAAAYAAHAAHAAAHDAAHAADAAYAYAVKKEIISFGLGLLK